MSINDEDEEEVKAPSSDLLLKCTREIVFSNNSFIVHSVFLKFAF